jgi:predicted short-subunit dehydrogenase-like oxidoreductase (DUF2520 family)
MDDADAPGKAMHEPARPGRLPGEVALIGAGRVGLRLVTGLATAGVRLAGVRDLEPIGPEAHAVLRPLLPDMDICDTWDDPAGWRPAALVLVCVPDRAIAGAARRLAASSQGGVLGGATVLHTSGLLPASVLAPCAEAGAAVGSLHPLQSFPPPGAAAVPLDGVAAAVEGDDDAVEVALAVARALGMRPWRIEAAAKARYHAAAVLAANLTHLLIRQAAMLLEGCGLEPAAAGEALAPLVLQSTTAALAAQGLEALTGPAVRGDTTTITAHLQALPDQVAEAYRSILALLPGLVACAAGSSAAEGSRTACLEQLIEDLGGAGRPCRQRSRDSSGSGR